MNFRNIKNTKINNDASSVHFECIKEDEEDHHFYQGWGETTAVFKSIRGDPGNSTKLAVEGQPRETAQIPRHHYSDHAQARLLVLVSKSTKQAVLLELMVLWEEWIQETFVRKRAKDKGLVDECQSRGQV